LFYIGKDQLREEMVKLGKIRDILKSARNTGRPGKYKTSGNPILNKHINCTEMHVHKHINVLPARELCSVQLM
jgi:hypothetical protein